MTKKPLSPKPGALSQAVVIMQGHPGMPFGLDCVVRAIRTPKLKPRCSCVSDGGFLGQTTEPGRISEVRIRGTFTGSNPC